MKLQINVFMFCIISFIFFGCEGTPEEKNEKIDKAAETLKESIDILKEKTKDIANDEELQSRFKDFLKDVEMESKDIEKLIKEHGAEWKEKLEELSDDPKLQEKLKELNGDADEVKKKLEEIFKEISEEN